MNKVTLKSIYIVYFGVNIVKAVQNEIKDIRYKDKQ